MDGVGAPTDGRPPQGASTGTQGGHHSGPNDTGHRQQRLLRLAGWPLRGLSRCNSSLSPLLPPPLRLRLVRLLFSVLLTRGPNLSTTAKALLRSSIRSQYEISGGTAAQNRFYAPIKTIFRDSTVSDFQSRTLVFLSVAWGSMPGLRRQMRA